MLDRILNLPAPVRIAMFGVIAVAMVALGIATTGTADPAPEEANTSVVSTETDSEGTVVVEPAPDYNAEPQENPEVGGSTDGVRLELAMPVSDANLQRAAEIAVEFTQLFLSYKYNQDDEEKQNDIDRLLAEANAIDMGGLMSANPLEFEKTETTVSVEVTAVEVVLISEANLAMRVAATSTTSANNAETTTTDGVYSVNLVIDGPNGLWRIVEFFSEGDGTSPFQDENTAG